MIYLYHRKVGVMLWNACGFGGRTKFVPALLLKGVALGKLLSPPSLWSFICKMEIAVPFHCENALK